MWELDHKEGWVLKNWWFWTVVLEKTFESLLESKVIKPIRPKGTEPWTFTGRTDAEAPILWPPDGNSLERLVKTLMLGKIEGRRRRGWQRMRWLDGIEWLNEQEVEQTSGDSKEQGNPVSCSPWGCKKSDTTDQLSKNHRTFCFPFHQCVRKNTAKLSVFS